MLVSILWPSLAAAQVGGYYLELSGGPSETTVEFMPPLIQYGRIQFVSSQASDFSADSDMVSLSIGTRFNDTFAMEVSYTDYGSFSGPATVTGAGFFFDRLESGEFVVRETDLFVEGDGEYETAGISASLIGNLPLGRRLNVYGKLGFVALDIDWKVVGTGVFTGDRDEQLPISGDASARTTAFSYGAGLAYRFNLSYGVRLEYQELRFDSRLFSSTAEIEGITLGIRRYF
ncbi:MAG: outer membrane beta-barrel protein [Cellvibrionaceae bacterium]